MELIEECMSPIEEELDILYYNTKYSGKRFSILGDSISTLEGYNPEGYAVFYEDSNCLRSGVTSVQDTWWDKVISFFGGELLVNNSWSGSRVTKPKEAARLFPSGCSDERTSSLHIGNIKPDVILIYLGTNDWAYGAQTGNRTILLCDDENEMFDTAYSTMLRKVRANYPESEIWCCTLCETYISKRPDFKFPYTYAGEHIEDYNEIIRKLACENGCGLIDLYDYNAAYDSVDGAHPTGEGMSTIAALIIRSMIGGEADLFLDCPNDQHEFKLAEEFPTGSVYVCPRCGKRICKNDPPASAPPDRTQGHERYGEDSRYGQFIYQKRGGNKFIRPEDSESEYVMLDPNRTAALYSDTLKLFIDRTGKTVRFKKDVVDVGRDVACHLQPYGKADTERYQATFFYEKTVWFLRDNFSAHGTRINGITIQPGKKYQLAPDDVIDFTTGESVVFYKHIPDSQTLSTQASNALTRLRINKSDYARSGCKDKFSSNMIISALTEAPLYFHVNDPIPLPVSLNSASPKRTDSLPPYQNEYLRIRTSFTTETGVFIPAYTTKDEIDTGLDKSVVRLYPQVYLPQLQRIGVPVVIDQFSESPCRVTQQMISEALRSLSADTKHSPGDSAGQPEDKYLFKTIDDKYFVLKSIGCSGFSDIYLVRDLRLNTVWAMKVCSKKRHRHNDLIINMFSAEAQILKRLDHPAIPKVIDFIENPDEIFLVREYVEGISLESAAKSLGAQPADKVVEWGKQLCAVLGYLYSQHPPLIYRDMKPANVILKPDGTLSLIDFGIVHECIAGSANNATPIGTRGYAAPEQFKYASVDQRTDIFGLGRTMFRVATGINPIDLELEGEAVSASGHSLHKGLEYIINKCIEYDPAERYQSCDELMADLNNYTNLPKKKGFFEKLFSV